MKTKQIIGLVVAVILFIITGFSSVLSHSIAERFFDKAADTILNGEVSFSPPGEDYLAVVNIVGTIQEQTSGSFYSDTQYQHSTNLDYIDELIADDDNQGILLYVDSGGGTVYESQEMYDKLMEYKELTGRPIYAYMAHYGASGAYMISMAADRIYANQGVTTGSIGVRMSGYDLSGLYEKLGIKAVNIASGKNKVTEFNEEQIAIYQSQVDEYYENFVEIVAKGRNMTEKQVKKLADGRTYTAKQALENGLIDEIGYYDDVKEIISTITGVDQYYSPEGGGSLISTLFSKVEDLIPKSDSQILKEAAEDFESGVFLYDAGL